MRAGQQHRFALAGPVAHVQFVAEGFPVGFFRQPVLVETWGIDRFLDMGRSATNAVGNSIASAVIAAVISVAALPMSIWPQAMS